jgi:tetratricopeptide (TPR) repeat protein
MGRHKHKKAKQVAADPPPPPFADTASELEYYKSRGNAHFEQGAMQMAIECYTKALKCNPNSAILLSNRSVSLLKAHRYEEALTEAEMCVKADPLWAKGYFRKGKALAKLCRASAAEQAFAQGLKCDEANKELQDQVKRMGQLREKECALQGEGLKEQPPPKNQNRDKKKTGIERVGASRGGRGRKRTRGIDEARVDEGHHKQPATKRQKQAHSQIRTPQEKGFASESMEARVQNLKKRSQNCKSKGGLNVMGRAGESDRHYVEKMPRWCNSGKSRGQKRRHCR